MRSRRLLLVLTLLALAAPLLRAAAGDPRIAVSREVRVAMRDGARLATDVYRPASAGRPLPGRFPVVLERTPYDREWLAETAAALVRRGYVFVAQSVRGRYGSEGRFRPHRDDGADGFDTAAWIAAQPWSDGGIGMVGTSWDGGTQHAMALARPKALKALVPVDAMSNGGRFGIRHQGAMELRFLNWILNFGFTAAPVRQPGIPPEAGELLGHLREQAGDYARHLPLRPGTTPLALAPDYEAWIVAALSHGGNDAFWRDMGSDVVDHVADYEDVPVYHVGGWYDSWGHGTADLNYAALAKAKRSLQRLIMGPWTHGGQEQSHAGEAEFGPAAAIDLAALQARWLDRWLKNEANGVDREPPVRIFVMGGGDGHRTPEGRIFVGGHWRDEREWPLARAQETAYYLHAGGGLSPERPGASSPTRYTFDPRDPVPTMGGNISSEDTAGPKGFVKTFMLRGAMDQRCRKTFWLCTDERPLAARNDVLVFETPPLTAPVEITGPITVRLFVSSSAPDTDFTAKLVDVWPTSPDFPAGFAMNVSDGILRMRFRAGGEKEETMVPGRVYPAEILLYPTSLLVPRGHRLRLDVSSSNFPRFDVNPNTGEPLNDNRRWQTAENAVYHDRAHPSAVLLPLVTRAP
jgi:putative CocE/NonD family hydrolase